MLIGGLGVSTMQERAELLRRWVASGENLQNCEHTIKALRTNSQEGKRKMMLIAVKDMTRPPFNFSKQLGCTGMLIIARSPKYFASLA